MALTTSHRRSLTRLALAVGAVLTVASLVPATGAGAAPASARAKKPHPAAKVQLHGSGRYLALGDSVAFGYTPAGTTSLAQYANAANFISYPQDVATALGLKLTNASCPGETTTSFVSATAQSNSCESAPGGGPGYRSVFPLHTSYSGTQLSYALGFLKKHPDTSLVTLQIGANDAFLCQETTSDQCVSEIGTVLDNISAGVGTILKDLRTKAHYTGAIALVDYYSTDYRDALQSGLTQELDQAVATTAQANRATVVSGFDALEVYAAYAGGDTCAAGLLVKLPTGTCDVHPTPFGHLVLAQAVEQGVHSVLARELNGRG